MEKRIAERIVAQITDVFASKMVEEFFFLSKLKCVFNSLEASAVSVFPPDTWAAGVPPSLDGLALVAL